MEKSKNFFKSTTELFTRFGIKSLTMDDIARHLGISKKTIYQFVKDKKELVKKGMALMIKEEQSRIIESTKFSKTAIDELIEMTKCVSSKLGDIHPSVIYDLQKYHPEAWKILENHKQEFIHNIILNNIKRGVSEGYYRKNINPEIIANVYICMMDNIINPESSINKTMSLEELHLEIINYHIKGISNEKGVEYLKKALENSTDNKLSID